MQVWPVKVCECRMSRASSKCHVLLWQEQRCWALLCPNPLYGSSSRRPAQSYARMVCWRAKQRSHSPRSSCCFLGALLSHHAAAWTSSLKTGLNLCFLCWLSSLQLNSSVVSPRRESNKRTACSLRGPSTIWIYALTSSCPCGREVLISLFCCPLQMKDTASLGKNYLLHKQICV